MALLSLQDAISLVKEIEVYFEDQPRVYEKFLKIMNNYKVGRIRACDVVIHTNALFSGHDHITEKLNQFLPEPESCAPTGDETTNNKSTAMLSNSTAGRGAPSCDMEENGRPVRNENNLAVQSESSDEIDHSSEIDTFSCVSVVSVSSSGCGSDDGSSVSDSLLSSSALIPAPPLIVDTKSKAQTKSSVKGSQCQSAPINAVKLTVTHAPSTSTARKKSKPVRSTSTTTTDSSLPVATVNVIGDVDDAVSTHKPKRARRERNIYDPGVSCSATFYAN